MPQIEACKRPLPNEGAFQKNLGRLVQAYSRIESRLVVHICRWGGEVKCNTMRDKINLFQNLGGEKLSSVAKEGLDRLLSLNPIRADLVHGTMVLIDLDGERFACFRNARHSSNPIQPAILLTNKSLRDLADELDSLATAIFEQPTISKSSDALATSDTSNN